MLITANFVFPHLLVEAYALASGDQNHLFRGVGVQTAARAADALVRDVLYA